ncbi:hypothetical protein pdam_00012298 [Pocillopora damicornis]|uniref:Uncharacterized protein n=1 Tax=Pocillopora damicornis TaxID=46731 RepID=A0A3M6T9C6_POCDA|nr:hypothetical protein pdam_00012298 [Pocillopora damicornis]
MVADRVQAAKFGLTAKLYFEELNEKARNVEGKATNSYRQGEEEYLGILRRVNLILFQIKMMIQGVLRNPSREF